MIGRRLLFLVNDVPFFLSHRLPLALNAAACGAEVHVAAPTHARSVELTLHGLTFHSIPLTRSSYGLGDLWVLAAIYALYRRLRPDLVHHVTIKPVLYGGIAARAADVPATVSAVSGLGYVFMDRKARRLRWLVRRMYGAALAHPKSRVIFQNPDDRSQLEALGVVRGEQSVLIRGSGVDLTCHTVAPEAPGTLQVTMAARMLGDKGVYEFVEAARAMREKWRDRARFVLVGDNDPGNPTTVQREELEEWHREGVVEWWGHRDDISSVFANSHVVVLPSYREGLPKVLLEAAACGRAIVTTDVPGCREVVAHEVNGLLVPMKDAVALASAIDRLLEDDALRRDMGRRGRERAEAEFDLDLVVREHMALYEELLS